MLQQVNQTEARDLEWSCLAVSPMDELQANRVPSAKSSASQNADSAKQKIVNDVSFGREVRFLAITLPQFSSPKLFQLRILCLDSDENGNVSGGFFPER